MADGFSEYSHLAMAGISGIIRGDEGFGWAPVSSSEDVRKVVGGEVLSDFNTISHLLTSQDQIWPKKFHQRGNESLEMWRDRLYHTYRAPTYLAAWNSIKTPYVEVVNPLMTRRVLSTVRQMPDELRTDKRLFSEYVMERSNAIPEANSPGSNLTKFLSSDRCSNFLVNQINNQKARSLLGSKLIDFVIESISLNNSINGGNSKSFDRIKRNIGNFLPSSINKSILKYIPISRPEIKLTIPSTLLAARIYTIISIRNKMASDANCLR
jgi:hypothetical protein